MEYNYVESKKRVYGILADPSPIRNIKKLDNIENRVDSSNGVRSWLTVVYIDIVDSKSIYSLKDEVKKAKILRAYTSECLEIIYSKLDMQPIEAGVLGDKIYAVYSTPSKKAVYSATEIGFYINTYQCCYVSNLFYKY